MKTGFAGKQGEGSRGDYLLQGAPHHRCWLKTEVLNRKPAWTSGKTASPQKESLILQSKVHPHRPRLRPPSLAHLMALHTVLTGSRIYLPTNNIDTAFIYSAITLIPQIENTDHREEAPCINVKWINNKSSKKNPRSFLDSWCFDMCHYHYQVVVSLLFLK